ncbi:hypothetical protein [Treponema sp. R80B11-R83G3]
MKKSKFLIFGLITLLLVGGLVVVSCGEEAKYDCTNNSPGRDKPDVDSCNDGWDGFGNRDCLYNCQYTQHQKGWTHTSCICIED